MRCGDGRTIESAMVNARERATDAVAAARTAKRDELDSQSSGPSDERIKTERRNPAAAAAFLRRCAGSGAPLCIITRDLLFAHSTTTKMMTTLTTL